MSDTIKESGSKLLRATERLESLRRAVNEAYSQALDTLDFDFSSTLDQLADQQDKLGQAWGKLVVDGDVSSAEADASRTVEEALRITLSAWRAFIEARKKEADDRDAGLQRIQADVSDLIELKGVADQHFKEAVTLHEKNDAAALQRFREVADEYAEYTRRAKAKIAGTQTITRREHRRQLLAYAGAILGLLALLITLVGRDNVFEIFRKLCSLLPNW